MNGKIISSNVSLFRILLEDGNTIETKCRKTMKFQGGNVYVGDNVILDEQNQICEVLPRKNLLTRPKISNIDYAVLTLSLKKPEFSWYLLDKFLVMINYCNIKPLILLTKYDLLNEKEKEEILCVKQYYDSLGYKVFLTSTKKNIGLNDVLKVIYGKTVAFIGQTGSGKSSAINYLCPSLKRLIGEYSEALGRGKHKTTDISLFAFQNGFIGDTPGFSSLELDIYKKDLPFFFPKINSYLNHCYYDDCKHINEPNCLIRNMVNSGQIARESYENYIKIYEELKKEKY